MPTSQVLASKSATTRALDVRRFTLMAAEHVVRMGARIKARREEVGLTQRELAEKIPGKSDGNQVSKWERGEHRVSDDTLEHIARALDVDAGYFMVAEPVPGSADLVGALAEQSQLDRIEAKLDELLDAVRDADGEAVEAELDDATLPTGERGASTG